MMEVVHMNKNIIVNLPSQIIMKVKHISGGYVDQPANELHVLLIDDTNNNIIKAFIRPASIPIFLYSGNTYQSLDSLTDEQIKATLLARLGNDVENKLNSLLCIR